MSQKNRKPATHKSGINPITVPAKHPDTGLPMNLTISRIHMQEEGIKIGHHRGYGDPVRRMMHFMIWFGPADEAGKPANSVIINVDENKFIEAIGHLFPHGELAEAHIEKGEKKPG